MNACPPWQSVARAFEWDGSWRDIYILNTSVNDWDVVLKALSLGSYGFKFICSGESWAKALPSFANITLLRERSGVTSSFVIVDITIKCHFFTDDTIEFDLDPREVNAENWPELCNFLFELSRITEKPCRLTEENCPDLWWLEASASTSKLKVFEIDSAKS